MISPPAAPNGDPAALREAQLAPATPVMPIPVAHGLQAPPDWKTIDFISDLHLCQALPRTFAAFEAYLQSTPADAVFILGDLFELWVGDDMAVQPFERHCVDVLQTASRRLMLAFMVGNRDFLVGPQLLAQAGMVGLPDPSLLQAFGQRVLLTHGDALCLDDRPYQAFRQEVRGPAWQQRFLAQSLAERLQVAAQIRNASRERQRFDSSAASDIDTPETLLWLQAAQASVLVHGHTHRPGSNSLAPDAVRHVLTDWNLDVQAGKHGRAEILRFSGQGFERLPWPEHQR